MNSEKIYKKVTYGAIYVYLFVILSVLIVLPFVVPENAFSFHPIMLIGIGLQFIPLLFYQYYRHKKKVIVSNDSIVLESLFKKKELKFNEIKGFEKLYWFSSPSIQSHIVIQPVSNHKDSIKIDLSYKNINELTDWIETKFENLDNLKEIKNRKNLLNDARFGSTANERQIKITQSKKIANTLTFAGLLIPLLLIITNTLLNNDLASIIIQLIIISIPVLSIIAIIYFKGLIKLDSTYKLPYFKESKDKSRTVITQNKSIYSDVSLAFLFPSIAIGLVAFSNYNILDFSNLWKLSLSIGFIALAIILLITKEFVLSSLHGLGKAFFYFVFLCAFGYGSTLVLNDVLDNIEPILYDSMIKKKTVTEGSKKTLIRSKKYTLIIEPWDQYKGRKAQIIEVPEQLFNTKKVGDIVHIQYHKGKINIPWFSVSK